MMERFVRRYQAWQAHLPDAFQVSAPIAAALVAALLLGWMVLLSMLLENLAAADADMTAMRRQVALASREEPEAVWIERRDQAVARLAGDRSSVMWQGETLGLVTATMQSNLAGIVRESGLDQARIDVFEQPLDRNGLTVVEATISGRFSADAVGQLIEAIEAHEPALRIEAVDVRVQRPLTVSLALSAPILIAEGDDG